MEVDVVYIYGLRCPVLGSLRYVGQSRVPEARFASHLSDGEDTEKTRWIKSLKGIGVKPELVILDKVPARDRAVAERYWINKCISEGAHLTNIAGIERKAVAVMKPCWVCEVCGHAWLQADAVPTHCASSKCRSRKWNKVGGDGPRDTFATLCEREVVYD